MTDQEPTPEISTPSVEADFSFTTRTAIVAFAAAVGVIGNALGKALATNVGTSVAKHFAAKNAFTEAIGETAENLSDS